MGFTPNKFDDDYLQFVNWLPKYFFTTKTFLNLQFYSFTYWVFHTYITIRRLMKGDYDDSFLDVLIAMGGIQGIVSLLALYFALEKQAQLSRRMVNHFWSTRGIPTHAKSQIEKKIKLAKAIVVFVYVITFLAGFIAAPGLFVPHWPIFSACSLWHCVIFMGLTMGALLGICLTAYAITFSGFYYAVHINMQLYILSTYFDGIGEDIDTTDIDDVKESEFYQSVIRRRLLIGIKHHIELVRCGKLLRNMIDMKFRVLLAMNGMVLVAFIVFYALTVPQYYVYVFLVAIIIVLVVTNYTGQVFIDGYSDFAGMLHRCRTFDWDIPNQKLFILFLTFAQIEQTVVLVPPVVISLEALLWMYKTMYSIICLVRSVH